MTQLKIIVAYIHYPVCSGRYITEALRNLDHDVRTLGDSTGNQIWGTVVDPKYAWQSDGDLTKSWDDWQPDLIIIAESAWQYHHPVYQDVPHVVWGVDNHVRDYRQRGIARYFLAHRSVSMHTAQFNDIEGVTDTSNLGDDATWLPCATSSAFKPSPIPFYERYFDVCLVGVLYDNRIELLNALHKAGLKVFATTGLLYDEYQAAYHNSRISLCVSACGDLAQRVFETSAMGCAILTDPVGDLVNYSKELGLQGFAVYEDVDSAVAQAKELLSVEVISPPKKAPKDTIAVAQGGYGLGEFAAQQMCEAVLGKHNWEARANVIVQWYLANYRGETVSDEYHGKSTAEH